MVSGVQQALQPVYQLASGNVIALPVSLGPSTEQVYLELYGTGFRNAKNFTATVGGLSVPVLGAAATSQFVGEDQVNIGPVSYTHLDVYKRQLFTMAGNGVRSSM